jgi:cell division protein FtsB
VEVNDSLKREYEVVSRRNNILEANLASLQDELHDGEM